MSHHLDHPETRPRLTAAPKRQSRDRGKAGRRWSSRRNTVLVRAAFPVLAAALDFTTIMAAAVSAQFFYHLLVYRWAGVADANLETSLYAASAFLLANAVRHDYAFVNYLEPRGHAWRCFSLWGVVSLLALAIGFLTRSTEAASRGAFLLSSVVGFLALCAERGALSYVARASAAKGGVTARRLFLVGYERDIENFIFRYKPWTAGMTIVASVVLRESRDTLEEDLALAAASARVLRPDDVFLLAPWSRSDVLEACVTAFLRVPARIHLRPEDVLDRFANARIDKVGAISSFSVTGQPHGLAEIVGKRVMDIAVSVLALLLLSPLLLLCALLIRLESPGPAFFLQRRYGFNRETFRIVKFRTMRTMEDGREVKQATADDPRVTRIGRFLRRANIDELPQLLNVLRGEMSLVGPRPHAVAHDQLFERRIALYARRHNVKPGITGWAQVNGLRGEIDSPDKIKQRVEHDLYYIDNWSLVFDVWILFLTVCSRKAYRNAV